MKRILLSFLLFLLFAFPVLAQFDDIQEDPINVNQFIDSGVDNSIDNITGEHIKSFDTKVSIKTDGSIDVTETIVYDFSNLDKHGIYRDIPYIKVNSDNKKYEMEFYDIRVTDDKGESYRYSESNKDQNISLKIGDPNRTITGINTYIISYTVKGALTYYSDHDELYWNTTGNGWNYPMAKASAKIVLPQSVDDQNLKTACYTGFSGSSASQCEISHNTKEIFIDTIDPLYEKQGLTIVIGFPKNMVAVVEPKEVVDFWDTLIGKLVGLVIGLLVFIWYVGLPIFIVIKWFRIGRDPKSLVGVTTAWYDPPKTQDNKRFLLPGEVGTLGDETVDMKDISASIVDLARRGYLVIDERKKGDFYLIKKKEVDKSLEKYEQTLINEFFGSKKEIRIKDEKLVSEVETIKEAMYKQVVDIGLFPHNPNSIRTIYYVLAGVALFTGNFMLAIISFIFGKNMPRKTQYGSEAKNVAMSLKNFLSTQKRQLEFQAKYYDDLSAGRQVFEQLLPYAIVFGVEKIWAKRFENLNIAPPSWYHSYSTSHFNSLLLVNSLNSSFRSVTSSATPTRSSSGFSSGFSGGFSGGGGGGGGGGSW